MSRVYFISDLHLGHRRVLEFHDGFRSKSLGVQTIEEHDEMIFDHWNETVKKRDVVFVLGDLGYNLEPIAKLPGHKRVLLGNHDELHIYDYLEYFDNVIGNIRYKNHWLCHIPMHETELYGRSVIHGHTHSSGIADPRYINVCVEFTRGKLIDFQDIKMGKYTTYDKVNKKFEDINWD